MGYMSTVVKLGVIVYIKQTVNPMFRLKLTDDFIGFLASKIN